MCVQWDRNCERVLRPTMASPDVPSPNTLEKDAGFCSGGDDDDSEESNRSNSDDSGLKMGRVVVPKLIKNKRKCMEPLKLPNGINDNTVQNTNSKSESYPTAPLKKRIRYDHHVEVETSGDTDTWDPMVERVPPHPAVVQSAKESSNGFTEHQINGNRSFFSVDALLAKGSTQSSQTKVVSSLPPPPPPPPAPREQRNYKNMTRERRIEANARERTRVHTISAAFDTLRKSIPAYSHNQKLSKLSVLRIACSYIMALSKVAAGDDVDDDTYDPSLAECIESVSKTIQTEGKLRKRRDDV